MRKQLLTSIAAFSLLAATPALADHHAVPLKGADGNDAGTVEMTPAKGGTLLTIEVNGLSEGWHGFHIHEKGDCSAEDFTSAGGHAHKEGEDHGYEAAENNHAGDLPNIWVAADGHGKAQAFTHVTDDVLHDEDGSAFIVHEGADDYVSQPSGAAGARAACGVISDGKSE